MRPDRHAVWLSVALCWACGGGEPAPVAGTPAQQQPGTPAAADTATTAGPVAQAPATQDDGPSTELVREAFSYRGAGRDPFVSLLRSGDVRPLPQDIRVRAINYDARYPQRSVVTMQDTTLNRRYTLRVGDRVGRVRVVQIRATEVVISIEEFGVERQLVLPIRRLQEDNTP